MANKLNINQISYLIYGTGAPEGSLVGDIGAVYFRIDENSESNFYVKMTGDGLNTGWFYPQGGWTQAA